MAEHCNHTEYRKDLIEQHVCLCSTQQNTCAPGCWKLLQF